MNKLCIFCGRRVDSEEHVWPRWLLDVIAQWPGTNMRFHAARINQHGEIDRWKRGDPEIIVRSVCKKRCNEGWMSDLESEARPILTALINGVATVLTIEQQLIISSWIVKCALVFDGMDGGMSFYSFEERYQFRQNRYPFERATVWLGYYSGLDLRAYTTHGTIKYETPSPPRIIFVITMAFGRLVLQLLDIKFLAPHKDEIERLRITVTDRQWADATIEIMSEPPKVVSWPPSLCFNDSDRTFDHISNRFGVLKLD